MSRDASPLRTVRRAFEILHLLRDRGTLGVSEAADRLDLPKSTTHDYLRTLRELGYVVNDDGSYRLGFRLLELGGQAKHRNRLFQVARPELERAAEATGEVVSLNVEEDGEFVVLHSAFGENALRVGIYPGLRIPLHTQAAGKVLLAGFDPDRVDRIVERHGLSPRTDHTVTDRDDLDAELDAIAEQGYAVDRNEQVVGMGVVAAPIAVDDRVLGSIGLVCPADKLRDENYRAELVAAVQQSANVISVNYQYSP
jgi:DNA-binding IclR family transcriptional regulator